MLGCPSLRSRVLESQWPAQYTIKSLKHLIQVFFQQWAYDPLCCCLLLVYSTAAANRLHRETFCKIHHKSFQVIDKLRISYEFCMSHYRVTVSFLKVVLVASMIVLESCWPVSVCIIEWLRDFSQNHLIWWKKDRRHKWNGLQVQIPKRKQLI